MLEPTYDSIFFFECNRKYDILRQVYVDGQHTNVCQSTYAVILPGPPSPLWTCMPHMPIIWPITCGNHVRRWKMVGTLCSPNKNP